MNQMLKELRERSENIIHLEKCRGSGMFIPDPGSQILIFTHSGSRIQKQQQKRGVKKKFVVKPFL
jgi:hypothetical protein